jgi:hypothetical protein
MAFTDILITDASVGMALPVVDGYLVDLNRVVAPYADNLSLQASEATGKWLSGYLTLRDADSRRAYFCMPADCSRGWAVRGVDAQWFVALLRRTCRRVRSQMKADQKARGRYLGGTVPFGYRRGESGELVPHEAEQEAILEMVALRAQGRALRAIAEAVKATRASKSAMRAWRASSGHSGRADP